MSSSFISNTPSKPNQPETIIDLTNLIDWYEANCDGEWEHRYGIRLETLDNPGWLLTVDLIHTPLQGRKMVEVVEGCDPDGHPVSPNWLRCVVEDNQFRGACDPRQVARLFPIFDEFRAELESNPPDG